MGYLQKAYFFFGKKMKLFQKHHKHVEIKRGGGVGEGQLPFKPQTIPSYGQNFHFDTLLAWIKLLPSFELPTNMLLSSYNNYCHVAETYLERINERKNLKMKKYEINIGATFFYIKLTKPNINIKR